MSQPFSVAIDGPAGAGKSTVAKAVAAELGAVYLDTGAMYRAMGLYMKSRGYETPEAIARAVDEPRIGVEFTGGVQRMTLDGEDVTEAIRQPEASLLASKVGGVAEVRARLVRLQQEFAQGHSVVMDGRDIGTDVLPQATVKIFLTASAEERARRRFLELQLKGSTDSYEKVLEEIKRRDWQDAHRAASPMRQAEDAVRVDTSDMTLEEAISRISGIAREAIARKVN